MSFHFAAHTNILKLLSQVSELEKTAQEIYNNSGQFFLVTVGGRQLNILSKLPLPVSTVVCPVGSIKLDIFCGKITEMLVGGASDSAMAPT